MKIAIFITVLMLSGLSCIGKKPIKILVSNPLAIDRLNEIVELPISELENRIILQDGMSVLVKNQAETIIPSQVTYDGKLIFLFSVKKNDTVSYTISVDTLRTYESQVFGRHYPERKGDFAWENDRVGFRFYGKELKEIQAPTSALDLWYKRTDKLVLDEWYRKDLSGEASYHVDHGEGCDPYGVGQTLGGGNMAIFADSILHLNENFESFEVLDNGPLRVTFRLTYPALIINGQEIAETKTVSLDAGSQLTKIVQEYTVSEPLVVVAGFPKRQTGDSTLYQKGQNYFVYQEPVSEENGQIYLGILIPEGIDHVFISEKTQIGNATTTLTSQPNVVASTTYTSNKPIVYYTGFGWNKYGFESVEAFDKYMQEHSQKLEQPLTITIK